MFLLFEFVCGTPPSCLKVVGWWVGGGGLQHFSAQSPLVLDLIGTNLGLGLGGFGDRA